MRSGTNLAYAMWLRAFSREPLMLLRVLLLPSFADFYGLFSFDESTMRSEDEFYVRFSKQYLYDGQENQYLDCRNMVAHVGHSHPRIVACAQHQFGQLCTAPGFVNKWTSLFCKKLCELFPDSLDVSYLCNDDAEAHDLAIRLCGSRTSSKDILAFEGTFLEPHDLPATLRDEFILANERKLVDKAERGLIWNIHLLPKPKIKFAAGGMLVDWGGVLVKLEELKNRGVTVSCVLLEPLLFMAEVGFLEYPPGLLETIRNALYESGALIIMSESKTGLGRSGSSMWGFSLTEIVPDLVAVGVILGNGFPLAAVLTSRTIAAGVPKYYSTFGGNPLSCRVGCAVFEVIDHEDLIKSAESVGGALHKHFGRIVGKFPQYLHSFDGRGLLFCLRFQRGTGNTPIAAEVNRRLLEDYRIDVCQKDPNVLLIQPPMCFTVRNADFLAQSLEAVLARFSECGIDFHEEEQELKRKSRLYSYPTKFPVPGPGFSTAHHGDDDLEKPVASAAVEAGPSRALTNLD